MGGRSTPRPGRFNPGKDPVPTLKKVGLAPAPVWTSAENLAPTGIWSPDRPARNESPYRLSFRDPLFSVYIYEYIQVISYPGYSSCLHHPWRWKRQSVSKRRHKKLIRHVITQNKEFTTWIHIQLSFICYSLITTRVNQKDISPETHLQSTINVTENWNFS
jgi:hypothetical protein